MNAVRALPSGMLNDLEQHDSHCRMTFVGQNWWIAAKRWHVIALTNENGRTLLDTSGVNWPAYVAAAERMMR